jgi:hypothetical protein
VCDQLEEKDDSQLDAIDDAVFHASIEDREIIESLRASKESDQIARDVAFAKIKELLNNVR